MTAPHPHAGQVGAAPGLPGQKPCTRCRVVKPLDAFPPNANQRDGRGSWCRQCLADHNRARRATDPWRRDRDQRLNKSRHVALERLADAHPREFARLVADARREAGLTPIGSG